MQQFVEAVTKGIVQYLPEQMKEKKIRVLTVPKSPNLLTGISFGESEREVDVQAIIYLDDYLQSLNDGLLSFEEVLKEIVSRILEYKVEETLRSQLAQLVDLEVLNDKVQIRIEPRKDIVDLDFYVHIEYLDFVILFTIPVLNFRCTLSNQHFVDVENIYKKAQKNSFRTTRILPLSAFGNRKIVDDDFEVYVVQSGDYGASAICNKEVLRELSNIENDDLYIIMPSTFEILCFSKKMIGNDVGFLKRFLRETKEIVAEEDWGTDSIYRYDRNLGDVVIVG